MLKTALLILAWFLAVAGLYLALFAVDLDWNIFDWEPGIDLLVVGALYEALAMLTVIWFLSRLKSGRLVQMWALAICVVPVVMAFYLLAPEPLKPGLLGRDHSSPHWYRGSRLLVLSFPVLFWALGPVRKRETPTQHGRGNAND